MSRLLFVHAHPDDETLTCGIAMAHHVARGDEVHVLTCTLGEEGEVIPPGLAHLEGDPDDRLGPHRHRELTQALERIGAVMHVLGADDAAGRLSLYRDSGMAGSAAASHPHAFAAADLDVAGALVADVVREVRPDVAVTYDEHGGYGHPDHIQTHRVTRRALELLGPADRPRASTRSSRPRGGRARTGSGCARLTPRCSTRPRGGASRTSEQARPRRRASSCPTSSTRSRRPSSMTPS